MRDQDADGVAMVFRCGPHQRRLAKKAIPRIHAGAVFEQKSKGFGGTCSGGGHQDSFALGKNRVGVRPRVEQFADQGGITVDGGHLQRRHSVSVGAFHIGAGMSAGQAHNSYPLSFSLLGGAGGRIKGNRFVVAPEWTPVANVWLGVAGMFGSRIERIGESTVPLSL